jgi:hypothetical protein
MRQWQRWTLALICSISLTISCDHRLSLRCRQISRTDFQNRRIGSIAQDLLNFRFKQNAAADQALFKSHADAEKCRFPKHSQPHKTKNANRIVLLQAKLFLQKPSQFLLLDCEVGWIMKTILLSAVVLALFLALNGGCTAQDDNSTLLEEPSMNGVGAFPQGEAGLTAYVNTGQVVDLEKLKSIFSTVDEVGDNYILGVVQIPDWGGNIAIHLYADTDGWIVAYLKKDEPVSMVMQWGTSDADNPTIGVIKSTTLEDALYKAGDAAGVGIVSNAIKYYHFGFPNANRMMIIVKVQATDGSSIHQIEIPANYVLFDSAYYHYTYYFSWCESCGYSYEKDRYTGSTLKIDESAISSAATSYLGNGAYGWWRGMDRYKSAMTPGALHKLEISHSGGANQGSSGVATVLIYRAYK